MEPPRPATANRRKSVCLQRPSLRSAAQDISPNRAMHFTDDDTRLFPANSRFPPIPAVSGELARLINQCPLRVESDPCWMQRHAQQLQAEMADVWLSGTVT